MKITKELLAYLNKEAMRIGVAKSHFTEKEFLGAVVYCDNISAKFCWPGCEYEEVDIDPKELEMRTDDIERAFEKEQKRIAEKLELDRKTRKRKQEHDEYLRLKKKFES